MPRARVVQAEVPRRAPSASAALVPPSKSLRVVARAAAGCTACPLHAHATQTVFGSGPARAPIMLIGEQPGDHEDREGQVFVGPAGKILDALLEEAGIDRAGLYLTNAVKHFKHTDRGRRRLHARPNAKEIGACEGWLGAEIARVRPRVIVCLGAVAVYALFGPKVKLTISRGLRIERAGLPPVIATFHPSAVLRAVDERGAESTRRAIVADLEKALAWAVGD